MTKKPTIAETAQAMCDRERRKKPHMWFFIGDRPCGHCLRKAREKIKGKAQRART